MTELGQQLWAHMFDTPGPELTSTLGTWRTELAGEYPGADEGRQAEIAGGLKLNAVDLRSGLPDWRLKREGVTDIELGEASGEALALLQELGCDDLAGQAMEEIASLSKSNLLRLARMTLAGDCTTWWGNDYASGTRQAMQRGGWSLVTTNPVLVGIAAKEDPDYWEARRDAVREQYPNAGPEEIAEQITIEAVVQNAELLRPVWELRDEKLGLVSLQLSPKNAFDAKSMIEQALRVWAELYARLGGVPNVVFKVPGTQAGLEVAAALTRQRIGVNVTLAYALAQQIAFAGVIEQNSTAPLCFRTQMDGRVDDPIGVELKDAGVDGWGAVQTWATTAIRQRDYLMHSIRYGFSSSFCLGASGRGPWNIQRSIVTGPQPLFLTVFPDKREEFDAEPRELNPNAIWEPVPGDRLTTLLAKSPLFCQSYEPDGMTPGEFDAYLPLQQTLGQFGGGYDRFVEWCACQRASADL